MCLKRGIFRSCLYLFLYAYGLFIVLSHISKKNKSSTLVRWIFVGKRGGNCRCKDTNYFWFGKVKKRKTFLAFSFSFENKQYISDYVCDI